MTPLSWRSSSGYYAVVLEDEDGNLVLDQGRHPLFARHVQFVTNAMVAVRQQVVREALEAAA